MTRATHPARRVLAVACALLVLFAAVLPASPDAHPFLVERAAIFATSTAVVIVAPVETASKPEIPFAPSVPARAPPLA